MRVVRSLRVRSGSFERNWLDRAGDRYMGEAGVIEGDQINVDIAQVYTRRKYEMNHCFSDGVVLFVSQ